MPVSYDREHWEQLIETIIERVGVERFMEHAAYALEQYGYMRVAKYVEDGQFLASSEVRLKAFEDAVKMRGDVGAHE